MKKAIFLATLMFASASVFGIEDTTSVSLKESSQNSKFVEAMNAGDIEQVEQLIKDGVDVNNATVDGTTPLIFAVNTNDGALVDALIRLDADVNAEDSYHKTALSVAVDNAINNDNAYIVYLLVKIGKADIYKNGVFDQVMRGPDSEVKDFLRGVNLSSLTKAIKNSDVDGVKKALKDERIDVNRRDDVGYTSLMYAAAKGNLEIISLLLDEGAKVSIVSKKPSGYNKYNEKSFGDNALFFAARNGKTDALEMLMNVSGHDVKEAVIKSNKREDLSKNIYQSTLKSASNAKSLLKQRNNLGQTLLISALKNGREDTAIWLIDRGAGVNDTYYEIKYGDELGRNPVIYKMSPLAIAEQNNLQKAAEKLKDKGAVSVNMKLPDKLRKASDRRYRKEEAEANYEPSIEAIYRLYTPMAKSKKKREEAASDRQHRRWENKYNYEDSLEAVSKMYESAEKTVRSGAEMEKSFDRKSRRAEAEAKYDDSMESAAEMYESAEKEANYEDSLESAAEMYKNEEKQFPAEVRKARRAEAEANYDSSLRAASRMMRKGNIAAPKRKVTRVKHGQLRR
jgi:ankyrin repeat protein